MQTKRASGSKNGRQKRWIYIFEYQELRYDLLASDVIFENTTSIFKSMKLILIGQRHQIWLPCDIIFNWLATSPLIGCDIAWWKHYISGENMKILWCTPIESQKIPNIAFPKMKLCRRQTRLERAWCFETGLIKYQWLSKNSILWDIIGINNSKWQFCDGPTIV